MQRDDLVTFQVDGTHGSAVAGLTECVTQARVNTPRPVWRSRRCRRPMDFACAVGRSAGQHRLRKRLQDSVGRPSSAMSSPGTPWHHGLIEGVKGVQLAELGSEELGRSGAGWMFRKSRSKEQNDGDPFASYTPAANFARLSPRARPIQFPSKAETARFNRIAYAAAHVVADPLADIDPWLDTAIDWDKTIAFRHYLWDLGFGVAEAMDTAQRGVGLDWSDRASELIKHALEAARGRPDAKICCGVGTDHLAVRRQRHHRRHHPRLRRADRGCRRHGRQAHRHGEPGAGRAPPVAGRL